mmetsp:Transcript_132409/g.423777  ORF Transcript_132409/g.423777 Transcript_132409/m.423777 type:complete len:518 (+) Transcript_132409:217-1770(+)
MTRHGRVVEQLRFLWGSFVACLSRFSTVVFLLWSALTTGASSFRRCANAYEARLEALAEASNGPMYFRPAAHMSPQARRMAVATLNSRLPAGEAVALEDLGYTPKWIAALFRVASEYEQRCTGLRGRYWEVNVQKQEYLDALPGNVSTTYVDFIRSLPALFRTTICAPWPCGLRAVGSVVLPRLINQMLSGEDRDVLFVPLPLRAIGVEVFELTSWDRVRIDFAVIGLDHCGTTSLRNNLARHPEIGFPVEDEDDEFLRQEVQHRLLPRLRQVDNFNVFWRAPGRPMPSLVGVSNPAHFSSTLQRAALARVPGLRALLVVCDPVDRFEKKFWATLEHPCRHETDESARASCPSIQRAPGMHELFEESNGMRLRRHLADVRALFRGRLMVVHQEALQKDPQLTYRNIVRWLGATVPFPETVKLYRYNSVQGYRTGLCRNASLVDELQRRLLPDYVALEELFESLGQLRSSRLRARQTRCDRPEELAEGSPRCGVSELDANRPRCEPGVDIPNCIWCAY